MQTLKRTKICLILLQPVVGGNERFMLNLVKKLDRKRFEILFILFNRTGENAHLIPSDIKVIDLNMKIPSVNQITNPFYIFKLARIFKQFKPSVIFSTSGYPNLITILAKMISNVKAKLIIREITLRFKHLKGDKWFDFKEWVYKILYRHPHLIVAPSGDILSHLQKIVNLDKNRLQLIPNFVDQDMIREKLSAPIDLSNYSIKKDKPVIISVSRFTQEKGIDIAIQAVSIASKTCSCYYWIIGNGPEEGNLKKLAADLKTDNVITFLGYQENPFPFFKNADIFLLPSKYEGFSNALLEAMYCGVSCIATRYDDFIGQFMTSGPSGLLTEVDNVKEMSEKIVKLLQDKNLRETLSNNARLKVQNHHTDSVAVKKYEDLFTQYATSQY